MQVSLNNSNIAVPIDIQHCNLPITEAIPVTGDKSLSQKSTLLANAIAVRDTVSHYYDGVSAGWTAGVAAVTGWNNYNRRTIIISNSHDQPITVTLMVKVRSNFTLWDSLYLGVAKTVQSVTIPASGLNFPVLIASGDMAALDGILPCEVSVYIKAATAPTAGDITMKLVMWSE